MHDSTMPDPPAPARTLFMGKVRAPLRWCLFINPRHCFAGDLVELEAVLANEDVLGPGDYPVCLRVFGPQGTVWEQKLTLHIPETLAGEEPPLAVRVFKQAVRISGPSGQYQFVANMERGGAPAGGCKTFYVSPTLVPGNKELPDLHLPVACWGVDPAVVSWLRSLGIAARTLTEIPSDQRCVIVVGNAKSLRNDLAGWQLLTQRMATGSVVIFADHHAFYKADTIRRGFLDLAGKYDFSFRQFAVKNASPAEQAAYQSEFWGAFSFTLSGLDDASYQLELGMCEGCETAIGAREFDVRINNRTALEHFDILKEAGGPHVALKRQFEVRPENGVVRVSFEPHRNAASLSLIRLLDKQGNELMYLDATMHKNNRFAWLPLKHKGNFQAFDDWLYHKEVVARPHALFAGLPCRQIMTNEYYGPVISHWLYQPIELPDDVAAAAFAVGYPCPGGYASGLMLASYPFGSGRFIMNTFSVLDHVTTHPAAGRLLLNMIRYADERAR